MAIQEPSVLRPSGYSALVGRYELDIVPNWHKSFVAIGGTHRTKTEEGTVTEIYPPSYWPGDSLGNHLEFALKYDGTNLGILTAIFAVANPEEILLYIKSKPVGKYARRIWFLYEFLTDNELTLQDLTRGNYVDLLEPDQYYTVNQPPQVRRQRINNNLLGDRRFCPFIRRTEFLRQFEAANLPARCQEVVSNYSPEMLRRALHYLYTKETKSSFEIENIRPSSSRTERFISLLQLAERENFCKKQHLIDLLNRIIDQRFQVDDYRDTQNYVGETVAWQHERVHYACPKPEIVPDLMAGLIAAHEQTEKGQIHPVIQAAAIAYGLIFIHPFEDGNGRIHRFLIHNILARRGFTPTGIMFPVSAAMLKNPSEYDASLEAFSRPLMALVDYILDDEGRMTVQNDVAKWYAYIDMTAQAEALFRFIERTVVTELIEELTFLENYDQTKRAIQEIVDLPDRQIDLFIRFCLQNNGRLSSRKRASHFDVLTDEEVQQMEEAVCTAYEPS